MISFKVFNSVDEINAWCYAQPSIDVINIETLASNKTFKFRVWYEKEIEPNRRLPKNTTYYYVFINVTSAIFEIGQTTDNYTPFDDKLFESGNYFKAKSDAQKALNKIKAIFNNNKKH